MIENLEDLFRRQTRSWPLLARGIEGLARAQTRRIRIDWFDVFVRHIPHRVASTIARVDRESISRRPCFLCAANLPPEEEGLRFNQELTIYCNPYPIVDRHVTVAHCEHGAQRIANQFGSMLDLAVALPGYFVVYNGPECGASAPDHLHFQAGSRSLFPIETEAATLSGISLSGYARRVLVFRSRDRSALITRTERAIDLLLEISGKTGEPLINIALFHERGEWSVYLFPRGKHRPQVFETGELTVSPASIDLCGIFVVPLAHDFEKITGDAIASVFREVTLPGEQFCRLVERLERTA